MLPLFGTIMSFLLIKRINTIASDQDHRMRGTLIRSYYFHSFTACRYRQGLVRSFWREASETLKKTWAVVGEALPAKQVADSRN
ncbi:hypothetical protein [Sphingomonas faeni]|uniref:hypothetical protein n=1 Tax=Sphingomonas faeni TaxID=185950 RepID=UPI002786B0D9|nr:hypothetical protein [Sphingomonas faeni]MDQ0839807.1 hypothetical protein [Sphingomonas faeni]